MFEDDLDLIAQALDNAGRAFKGSTQSAFGSLAREIRRLKRCREQQISAARRQDASEELRRRQALGIPDDDDDIPF